LTAPLIDLVRVGIEILGKFSSCLFVANSSKNNF
jgi:hypothetical protein